MEPSSVDRPQLIKDARGKRPSFHQTDGIDSLQAMVMVLASELTVLRDRLDAAERVAKGEGLDLAAGIEKLELDEEALKTREAWRQGFMERLFYLARKESGEESRNESREGYTRVIDDIATN